MAEFKMGFIGTGNMGSALARAAAKSGERMLLANRTPEKAEALAAVLGAKVGTNLQAAAACEYIFLGVKPQMLPALLDELRPALLERTDRFLLVSMAAGVKTGTIRQALGFDCPVVRIMPNLPVASGTGVILLSPGAQVTEDELCELERLLQAAGLLMRMPEGQIDAGSAVSGCGPAYVYLFLDALANGGVACGLRYDQALALAAQTLIGAAGRPSPPASTRASSRPRSAARPGRRSRASARSSSAASAPPPWTPSSPPMSGRKNSRETDEYGQEPAPGSGAGAFAPVEAELHRLVQGEDARIS